MISDIGHFEALHRVQIILPMKWQSCTGRFSQAAVYLHILLCGCIQSIWEKWDNLLSASCYCPARAPHGVLRGACGEAELCSSPSNVGKSSDRIDCDYAFHRSSLSPSGYSVWIMKTAAPCSLYLSNYVEPKSWTANMIRGWKRQMSVNKMNLLNALWENYKDHDGN